MSGIMLAFVCAAIALSIYFAVRSLAERHGSVRGKRWAWLSIVAIVPLLFSDEIYNEVAAQRACAAEGGLAVREKIAARSMDEGMSLIEARKREDEEPSYWRHQLVFVYVPTGVELARLSWFSRKHGWLQGNEPGAEEIDYLRARPCPDPAPFLIGGGVRAQLVSGAAGSAPSTR